MNDKGQMSAGLIAGIIFGVATLVIGVIIAFTIVTTLSDADLLTSGRTSVTVTNESLFINHTGDTLNTYTNQNVIPNTFSITSIVNSTNGVAISTGNYTFSGGVVKNATNVVWDKANVTYTYTTYSDEEVTTRGLRANFTTGVGNVSSKIPTVLLVAAIVLILGVLVLLVGAWQRMRMSGGNI